jgi:hypothetical protein
LSSFLPFVPSFLLCLPSLCLRMHLLSPSPPSLPS